jgi:hypothetical protein
MLFLRFLLDVWVRSTEAQVEIMLDGLEIMFDPSFHSDLPDSEEERLYMNVSAPQRGGATGAATSGASHWTDG